MPVRASNIIPQDGYARGKRLSISAKKWADASIDEFSSATARSRIIQTLDASVNYINDFNDVSSIPGIAQHARDQENDPTYDVIAEWNALRAAVEAVRDEIISTFPTDGGGFWLVFTVDAAGVKSSPNFTVGQLSALRSALSAVSSAVI